MADSTTTATTSTAQVSSSTNAHYTSGNAGHSYNVQPHTPTAR